MKKTRRHIWPQEESKLLMKQILDSPRKSKSWDTQALTLQGPELDERSLEKWERRWSLNPLQNGLKSPDLVSASAAITQHSLDPGPGAVCVFQLLPALIPDPGIVPLTPVLCVRTRTDPA